MLGSPLFTTTVDRSGIADRLSRAGAGGRGPGARHILRGPLCGWPSRCTSEGYKVVLTGEGADEALAGYVWYKAQAWGNAITRRDRSVGYRGLLGGLLQTSITGDRWRLLRPSGPSAASGRFNRLSTR